MSTSYHERQGGRIGEVVITFDADDTQAADWATQRRAMYQADGRRVYVQSFRMEQAARELRAIAVPTDRQFIGVDALEEVYDDA